jgi:hypothetical protein
VTGQENIHDPGTWCPLEQLDYEGVAIPLRQDLMQPIVPPDVTRKDDHVWNLYGGASIQIYPGGEATLSTPHSDVKAFSTT